MSADIAGPRRVLYLSRDGVHDGLGESQILGYLRGLAGRHRVWLLTFEKSVDDDRALERVLAGQGIVWHALRFQGRGRPVGAAWGLVRFWARAAWLVRRHRIEIVHARGYLPCVVALAARLAGPRPVRVIFDMRGFWIDERAEAGQWRPEGRAYRLGKRVERWLLRRADAIVTLNDGARAEAARLRGAARPVPMVVIPTCVDVTRFRPGTMPPAWAPAWRERFVVVYSGSAGFWQDPDGLVGLVTTMRQVRPDLAFLCLLRDGAAAMRVRLERAGLADASHVEEAVPLAALPAWLGLAAVGIVWYRPAFSRLGNFPTKLGEYLACGLPVLVAGATADSVALVAREKVGVVLGATDAASAAHAVGEVIALTKDPRTAPRCRDVAERELSLESGVARYDALYRSLGGRAS